MSTRQNILDATERIIQARGIAKVTTKEIAREAGCAEGTLYKHFEHKEDLFMAVLQQYLPNFIEALHEHQAGMKTVQENLQAIALTAINYYNQLFPLAVAFFADTDLLTRHQLWMREMHTGPQKLCERLAAYIREEQQLGRIDSTCDALSSAFLILGPCFQYVFQKQFVGAEQAEPIGQQFVEKLIQTLTRGLLPCPENTNTER